MRFLGWEQGVAPPSLRNLFDDFCDSSVLGMRQVFFFPLPFNYDDRDQGFEARVSSSLIRSLPLFLVTLFAVYQNLNGVFNS